MVADPEQVSDESSLRLCQGHLGAQRGGGLLSRVSRVWLYVQKCLRSFPSLPCDAGPPLLRGLVLVCRGGPGVYEEGGTKQQALSDLLPHSLSELRNLCSLSARPFVPCLLRAYQALRRGR